MARKSRKSIPVDPVGQGEANDYCAAAYVRLSGEDVNRKGDSIETQKAIIESYGMCAPDITIHDFYVDNGATGTTFERRAFQQMIADIELGKINCIIVKDLSRLGRNAIDTGYYLERYFPSLGCRFIAINDNYDSLDEKSQGAGTMLSLKNVVNEAYALDIGRKAKAQRHEAMKAGEFIGGRPPYGYLKSPDDCHKLIVDPDAAPVVKQIFEWYCQVANVTEIVRRLNKAAVLTPSHHRREQGLIKSEYLIGNGNWEPRAIKRILRNETYIGDMVQGKTRKSDQKTVPVDEADWIRVADTHEAIISREVFASVQQRLKEVAAEAAAKPKTKHTPNIFKGKIFCGHCGSRLNRHKLKRPAKDYYYYLCTSNNRVGHGTCESVMLSEEDLLEALLGIIRVHVDAFVGQAQIQRVSTSETNERLHGIKTELAALHLEVDKYKRVYMSLYENYVSGLIDSTEYSELRESYELKTKRCQTTIDELLEKQADLDNQANELYELPDLLANIEDGGISAEAIDRLVDKIHLYSDKRIEVEFIFSSVYDEGFEVAVNG